MWKFFSNILWAAGQRFSEYDRPPPQKSMAPVALGQEGHLVYAMCPPMRPPALSLPEKVKLLVWYKTKHTRLHTITSKQDLFSLTEMTGNRSLETNLIEQVK